MSVNFLADVSQQCGDLPTFGEVLDIIRQRRNLTQKQFARRILRSEAEVSRLIHNQVPISFHYEDLKQITCDLGCSRIETVQLELSFTCYLLDSRGLFRDNQEDRTGI